MRPCTSTNIHQDLNGVPYHYTIEQSMAACKNAGFSCIDLNLYSAAAHRGPLSDSVNWKSWVQGVKEELEKLGLEAPYAHAYFYVHPDRSEYEEELTCRSLEAAGMLGVKWVTVHPYSVCDEAWYSHRKSLEDNLAHMKKYADILEKYDTRIAIENMVEDVKRRRFGSSAEDLLEILEALDNEKFGLCWDFGHGERSNCNTAASLRMMGKSLKNVHVHDYTLNKVGHDHTLPFLGITNWTEIMPVMKEIGYEGDWNLECHLYTSRMPASLRMTALKLAYETTVNMIEMAK